jgi:hypothetical protein
VYGFLEKLDALGFIDSRLAGIRPLCREEVARLLLEASDKAVSQASPYILGEIKRHSRRFRASIADMSDLVATQPPDWWKPLQTLQVRYVHLDGENPPDGELGRIITPGGTWMASASTHAGAFDFATLHLMLEAVYNEDDHPDTGKAEFALRLPMAYVKLSAINIELLGGINSMAWGPPGHDGLLLTQNPEPFRLVRIGNPQPVLLPWFFSALGPLGYQLFFTELGGSRYRTVPHPYLAGLRFDLRPFPWLELGFSRTFLFDGKSVEKPSTGDIFRMLVGYEESPRAGEPDISDQRAGLDARIRFPLFGTGVVLYGEAFGENVSNLLPYRWSWRVGIYLAGLLLSAQTLDLRAEWTRTHRLAYTHHIWSGGYNYLGTPIGHHAGPWAEDFFVELSWAVVPGSLLALSYDREVRKTAEPGLRAWTRHEVAGRGEYSPEDIPDLTLAGSIRLARHSHRLHIPGDDVEELTLSIEVRYDF